MQTLNTIFRGINLLPKSFKLHLSPFSSSVNKTKNNPDYPFLINYLIDTFNVPQKRAQSISVAYHHINSPEKPQHVLDFFQTLDFTQSDIRYLVRANPQILFFDVDKVLKPKIELFQQLGMVGSHLGKFLSKNSSLLTVSLEKRLIPNIEILKKILVNDKNNAHLIKVLKSCSWTASVDPKWRLSSNIKYLESCGIVGSQLSTLLRRKPRLFTIEESKLRELVSRTLDIGFLVNSRMLVHGLHIISCISEETFQRKFQVFRDFGFSKDQCMGMFRSNPRLLGLSEEKLKLRLGFFLSKMLIEKEVLLLYPLSLACSLEGRVIPRYRVLQIVESKKLLKKVPSVFSVLPLSEEKFLEKFVARFRDDAEELLIVYKGHMLDSSSSASSEEKDYD